MTGAADTEHVLEAPSGTFELLRHPLRKRSTLRAWDAADAYVLRYLAEHGVSGPVGIINDGFGALAIGLHENDPIVIADSAMSDFGISANLDRNQLSPLQVGPEINLLPEKLGTVVIKVTKSLGQLEEQLHQLRPKVGPATTILGAGMVRDIHTSTLELFESILGPTTTSLAERKSRLIHCVFDPELIPPQNPWPMVWRHQGIAVHNRGGVFSASSMDIGTRFLVEHLPPAWGGPRQVIDLGCGNGVLGVSIAVADPEAAVVFVDSSARAVDSAKASWAANLGARPAEFHRTDRLNNVVEEESTDLVLNNPPFHEERAIGDATAWDMFVDSRAVLRGGGVLLVVANRHLGHHTRLKKIFGNCETIASNRKFVVLAANR